MRDLIKKLLTEQKFNHIGETEKKQVEDHYIYVENKDKNMYYILSFYGGIDDFNTKFNKDEDCSFDFICSKENANEIKKNTSMIVFINIDDISRRETIQSKILDLEEDIYFFKKYVVTYTNGELNDLKKKVKEDNLIKFMEENINNEELFEEFKLNNTLSAYSLILKLFIKLPNMRYNDTFKSDNILDLNKKILQLIKEKELIELHEEFLEIDEKDIEVWIENKISMGLENDNE